MTFPGLMPARSAMSLTRVSERPRSQIAAIAASRTRSRRAALLRLGGAADGQHRHAAEQVRQAAANQQADGAENDCGERHHADDAVELLHFLLRGANRKTVDGVVSDVSAAAQQLGGLIDGLIQHIGVSLETNLIFVRTGINFMEGVVGNQHATIFITHSETTLGLLNDANDQEVRTVDEHILANRRSLGK